MAELPAEALKTAPHPMTSRELWDFAVREQIAPPTTARTPWHSLGAPLYVDTEKNEALSRFIRVGMRPVRFWLRSRPLPEGWAKDAGPMEDVQPAEPQSHFREKELHPLLSWFAREKLRDVRVKTISHSVSSKRSFGDGVHPDMIGVRLPQSFLHESTVSFADAFRAPILRMFSFELKQSVNFGSLRENFFQAVSNSSWANEGYLVAADWQVDDEEFSEELARLTQSFGIGAIHLCLDDLQASQVLHPARVRDEIDWTTLNKLVRMNQDVRKFLKTVTDCHAIKTIYEADYDSPPPDPIVYARNLVQR